MSIKVKYAIGYGAGGRFSKVPGEKTLDVDFEDLNLADDADDEAIRDALWKVVLEDIGRNANMDDVLDDTESVILDVHEAMANRRSRARTATPPKTTPKKRRAR